eukprot:gene13818-9890_t
MGTRGIVEADDSLTNGQKDSPPLSASCFGVGFYVGVGFDIGFGFGFVACFVARFAFI